jgi:hypothetical protein
MIEMILTVATIIFFVKHWAVPRFLVLAAIPLGVIFVNGIGMYRASVYKGQDYGSKLEFRELPQRVMNGFTSVFERADECILPDASVELSNATAFMDTISAHDDYDFGTGLWDLLVHRYVPAQIFGARFKASLKFNYFESTVNRSSHRAQLGSTVTGLTDAFQGFGYIGAVYFLISAVILRRVWENALAGNFTCQVAYGVLVREGLESVTHHSGYVFAGMIAVAGFVVVPLRILRRIAKKASGTNEPYLLNGTNSAPPAFPMRRPVRSLHSATVRPQ